MSNAQRLGVLALIVAAAVVALVVVGPGSSSKSSAKPVHITVSAGKPVGGIKPITVKKGHRVRFSVTSDVADEIHVHGYNVKKNVPRNGTVAFDFPATIDGEFVVELEGPGQQIADLKVEP